MRVRGMTWLARAWGGRWNLGSRKGEQEGYVAQALE